MSLHSLIRSDKFNVTSHFGSDIKFFGVDQRFDFNQIDGKIWLTLILLVFISTQIRQKLRMKILGLQFYYLFIYWFIKIIILLIINGSHGGKKWILQNSLILDYIMSEFRIWQKKYPLVRMMLLNWVLLCIDTPLLILFLYFWYFCTC